MGGRSNIGKDTSNLSPLPSNVFNSEKSVMDDINRRARPSSVFTDHKEDRDDSDKESTVSTIDSPFLLSLRHPSPPLSPLTGQQYLLHDDDEGDSDSTVNSQGHVVAGIAPYLTTVNGPLAGASGTGAQISSNNSSIVEMMPSAACSVSTAPSTADEASSIGMDSAAGMDYFRLRLDAAAYSGQQASTSTSGVPSDVHHRRIPSWEVSPHQQAISMPNPQSSVTSVVRSSHQVSSSGILMDHGGFPPLAPPQIPQHQHNASNVHTGRIAASQQLQHQRAVIARGENSVSSFRPPSPGARQQPFHYSATQQQHHQNWVHHHTQTNSQRYAGLDPQLHFTSQGSGRNDSRSSAAYNNRVNSANLVSSNGLNIFHVGQQHHPPISQQRKPPQYGQQSYPIQPGNTPARAIGTKPGHNRIESVGGQSASSSGNKQSTGITSSIASPHRVQQGNLQNTAPVPSANQTNAPRSSSEVLKTLLRRKACLYEPDTSRAVALVTWLVGRELALEYGYFSRQQLQAGVHTCVTSKIEAGIITRTKVNRCMQIILNSCFHYIIPRPDGTEESGETFRALFSKEVADSPSSIDAKVLLDMLPQPWREIHVNRDDVLRASSNADDTTSVANKKDNEPSTPSHSPRLDGLRPEERSPGEKHFSVDGNDGFGDTKRAVLLCFNENVRRAEDVFRCHNEFIRDTAHSSNLQLSSQEWQLFFGKEAASCPYLWGNIGIPIPFPDDSVSAQADALGVFNPTELEMFRTSWCSKRYDHNHDLCGFAHTEVNHGWLRRNPAVHPYTCELCPATTIYDQRSGSKWSFILNECPHGVLCRHAHSIEEIMYHPQRYKKLKTCSFTGRPGGCPLGDVCPNFHPFDSYRFPKKSDTRSPRHSRQQHAVSGATKPGNGSTSSNSSTAHLGSPVLYASPAPFSSFENQLWMPGLQALFRRQCSVVRANIRSSGYNCNCSYSYFGDDTGVENKSSTTISPSSSSRQEAHSLFNPTTQVAVRPP